jgi:hypothetical protein
MFGLEEQVAHTVVAADPFSNHPFGFPVFDSFYFSFRKTRLDPQILILMSGDYTISPK